IAVDFLLDFLGRHREEKNFIYYPMALPHWPVNPTPHSEDWADPAKRLHEDPKYFPDMVAYMDTLVGRIVSGVKKLGLQDDTMVIFYSDNGTNQTVTSILKGKKIQGGKATPMQTGIRVPLIVNWPGQIKPTVHGDLVEASDFLATFSDLTGKNIPADWQHDGVSFAPQLFGEKGTPRDFAFFWYDPRPGWDKEKFSRSIFALDHRYKLFSDGRLYAIDGLGYKEELLPADSLSAEARSARAKLQKAIDSMMQPPISEGARIEVDTYGNPLPKK
ncbi:MAG: sulfatase-like hydrolase/transferase, partial [Akkermansiaceae bacterium]